jgi:hypothetical protein
MADLNIVEYASLAYIEGFGSGGQIADFETIQAHQQIAIGASTQSAAFGSGTRIVRLEAEAICKIAYGSSPTAVDDGTCGFRMVAGQTEYIAVAPGKKVAVITAT